jgi:pimeloyl-ACP methyl ester carboxylesterase
VNFDYNRIAGDILMKALFLYGANCNATVWDTLLPHLASWECDVVSYPHDVTLHAHTVDDITQWVEKTKCGSEYDVIVGHSLGGLVALSLASQAHMAVGRVICLDTNLCPAGPFFRNLMTDVHMEQYGNQVKAMLMSERKFFSVELLHSVQENFDYTPLLYNIHCPIALLLGDRNTVNAKEHLSELNLPASAYKMMDIHFVPNACHMQMIENPEALANMLKEICQ